MFNCFTPISTEKPEMLHTCLKKNFSKKIREACNIFGKWVLIGRKKKLKRYGQ